VEGDALKTIEIQINVARLVIGLAQLVVACFGYYVLCQDGHSAIVWTGAGLALLNALIRPEEGLRR
jgi:hypothetical protein